MSDSIITRFPPSPTGYLHVGGARTALFNWLYARHMNGKFILRIEDTDTKRSTQESVDAILQGLEWLGIEWDEGPYFQSERIDIYKSYVQKLIDTGHAYYCTCSEQEIEDMRQEAVKAGKNPKYNGKCREKGLPKTDNAVVRFKVPYTGTTVLNDVVKKHIVFQHTELDDFIIQRSDGMPTYNFAVIVDDITMHVNTVIRGDDHVSNTPKQILLYNALNEPLPTYAHVPMVLGKDKTRLSKRHGAMSVTEFKDMGILPEALVNYLVRLGWSHGDQEFFTKQELIEKFSLKNIGSAAGIFDHQKLIALNAAHIQASDISYLCRLMIPLLNQIGCNAEQGTFLEKVIFTLQKRSKTLIEMADNARFYYTDAVVYEDQAIQKCFTPASTPLMAALLEQLKQISEFNEKNLESAFHRVVEQTGVKMNQIAQPIRVALTGKTASPGIFEIIEILGQDKAMSRIEKAIMYINEHH
ncbi:MAG: glutamate--tRNA ligase [Desulfobacterales bacterium]|nr:glutamate--tRNA ligase [Desulfobacterales bacterium]